LKAFTENKNILHIETEKRPPGKLKSRDTQAASFYVEKNRVPSTHPGYASTGFGDNRHN
jgi:hypothetical protein